MLQIALDRLRVLLNIILYYQKKLCFVHNMLRSDNSIIVSVMKLFVNSKVFTKLCEFADVTPYDNIHYIRSIIPFEI